MITKSHIIIPWIVVTTAERISRRKRRSANSGDIVAMTVKDIPESGKTPKEKWREKKEKCAKGERGKVDVKEQNFV